MLWAKFCWETVGPGIYVDVTLSHITYLNTVADKIHPFMVTVFPKWLWPLSEGQSALPHCKNEFKVLAWSPDFLDLKPVLDKQGQSMEAPSGNLQD